MPKSDSMMNPLAAARSVYQDWLQHPALDADARSQLEQIANDDHEIVERFARNLSFGTGGLRGILGVGTNRMNLFTVAWATQGLAQYLTTISSVKPPRSVCIAYDTRHYSKEFAQTVAQVLAGYGILVRLFDTPTPTPMLSFAVRYYQADAGVVITASHNPKQYNGYKIYGSDGGQITDEVAGQIASLLSDLAILPQLPHQDPASTLIVPIGPELDSAYFDRVFDLVLRKDLVAQRAAELLIVYTPLHGTGTRPISHALASLGFSQLHLVQCQATPDGSFPTVSYPNPEEESAFRLAKQQARQQEADLIFATDPDCDRIGVQVKNELGKFVPLTGNQVGALLCEYLLATQQELGEIPAQAAVFKTIVTTDLPKKICEAYGVALYETLTGFKYIGEQMGQLFPDHPHASPSLVFGFEESYGYLAGTFVRDKDAIIAAVLIAEMALYYHAKGMTLLSALQALYQTYGYTKEKLLSYTFEGEAGRAAIEQFVQLIRDTDPVALFADSTMTLAQVEDYHHRTRITLADQATEALSLPPSNVIKFCFAEGGFVVVRPSGTEPKLKIYLAVSATDEPHAQRQLEQLEQILVPLLDQPLPGT